MKDNMYFKITGWMIKMQKELKLNLKDLLLFAYMYQFKNKDTYKVSIYTDYFEYNLPMTNKEAFKSLQILLKKGIIKEYESQITKKGKDVYNIKTFLINKNKIGKFERKIDTSNVKNNKIDISKYF